MPSILADNTYYIDWSDDNDFTTFRALKPEGLAFDDQIRGAGNCSFQISHSALDVDGNRIVVGNDFIGPYRSYYRLRYGNVLIQGGVVTSTDGKNGDDFMSVACKTWEHFTERWQYPFDPRGDVRNAGDPVNFWRYSNTFDGNEGAPTGVETPQGLAYQANSRDIVYILIDILGMVLAVPNRIVFNLSHVTNPCGVTTNYQLSLGDTTFMDSLINGLAETGEGFDWWVTPDRYLEVAHPYRYGENATPLPIFSINDLFPLREGALSFTNNGPAATHVLGVGAGLASQTSLGRAYGYAPAQTQFSRLDASYDFGDVRNVDQIILKTQKQLSLDLQPQHDISLQLDPLQIPNFWEVFYKGGAIWIDYDFGYHRIQSYQQIMSYSAKDENNSGNVLVDLSLRQIYDLSVNAGSPEG